MSPGLPIRRLLVEGVVVVGSILLAFGIDAWWDRSRERGEERVILSGLVEELQANTQILVANSDHHRLIFERASALLSLAAAPDIQVSRDSLDHLVAGLSIWTVPVYERGALDATLVGGSLAVIENPRVRAAISEWSLALDRTAQVESEELYHVREVWLPLLRSSAHMPQIWNVGRARVPGWRTPETPVRGSRDHSDLLRSQEFLNVVLERRMISDDILDFQRGLRRDLDAALSAIQQTLNAGTT